MTAWVIAAASVSSVSRSGWLIQLAVGHAQIVEVLERDGDGGEFR